MEKCTVRGTKGDLHIKIFLNNNIKIKKFE